MNESDYNSQIEQTANLMIEDKLSPDEQDIKKLQRYKDLIRKSNKIDDEEAMKIVYDALLYLKLKNSDSADILQHGNQFGAGFS